MRAELEPRKLLIELLLVVGWAGRRNGARAQGVTTLDFLTGDGKDGRITLGEVQGNCPSCTQR